VRQRFTIAHEIGHYLLHRFEHDVFFNKTGSKKLYRNEDSTTGKDQMEIEANAFAAALLMPEARVKKEMKTIQFDMGSDDWEIFKKLAKTFKVSNQAMMFRMANLQLL